MIEQPSIASNTLFTETYQETLGEQWKQLADMKSSLEERIGQDITVDVASSMITRIHEISRCISGLPECVLQYIVSRDALLEYLRKSSIELHLLRDQLLTKGRTRRYYNNLFACQRYLEQGLQQQRNSAEDWQSITWEKTSVAYENIPGYVADASLRRGREYQKDLHMVLQAIYSINTLFYEGLEVWPDQCTRSLTLLQNVQELLRETCSFLDSLAASRAALSPHYCQLIITMHHASEQTRNARLHLARYQTLCRSSSSRSISTRHTIVNVLAELLQYTDTGTRDLTMLLDQAYFQERNANDGQTGTHFA